MEQNLTAVEIVGLAIKGEIAAENFYRKVSDKIGNVMIKDKFVKLASEEASHQQILLSMLKQMTGEEEPPIPSQPLRDYQEINWDTITFVELLEFAIKKEREARELYLRGAKEVRDPSGRRMMEYLAEFERGHEQQLKLEYEQLKNIPGWWDMPGPDIMLVGP